MLLLERDGALATLAERFRSAETGTGSVVVLHGEPGIGKSTVVSRFTATLGGGRVLAGWCDDLLVARALGPLHDLAGDTSPALRQALSGNVPPAVLHQAVLAELSLPERPVVMVIEDIHWADDATLDLITVVARRIEPLPAMLVLTSRPTDADDRVRHALASLPAPLTSHVPLHPLSLDAVHTLVGEHADRVHALSAGNPFYVTELSATGGVGLPPTVSQAVLARVAHLPGATRRLLELISVVPARTELTLLDGIAPDWVTDAEPAESRGILEIDRTTVKFRHELARTAVEASLTAVRRRMLNRIVLAELVRADNADPARTAHHAELAGDIEVLSTSALAAARRASTAGARIQAYSHYRRAIDLLDRLPVAERAIVYEEFAEVCYITEHLPEALAAANHALSHHVDDHDALSQGRVLRLLSRLHWMDGNGSRAHEYGAQAVAILEPLGPSPELAMAYSNRSQLAQLAGNVSAAERWGVRAIELAEVFDDRSTLAHALVNVGTARVQSDPDDHAPLLEAFDIASDAGVHHEAVRSISNLSYQLVEMMRLTDAEPHLERAAAYAEAHEVHALHTYLVAMRARFFLLAGRWVEAQSEIDRAYRRSTTVSRLLTTIVDAHLRVRRGDPDAAAKLAAVTAEATRTGETQRLAPVCAISAELAWLHDAALPIDELRSLATGAGVVPDGTVQWVAAWLTISGDPPLSTMPATSPWGMMAQGRWEDARVAFTAHGLPYEAAMAAMWSDSPEVLHDAVAAADLLGAVPLAVRLRRRARRLGVSVPGRRRSTTTAHPAGLTRRQLDVLRLVAGGLSNADIADRLYVSVRTVEHHVAAVLTKLDAASRQEAAATAKRDGYLDAGDAAPSG